MRLDPDAREKLLEIIQRLDDAQVIAEAEHTRLRMIIQHLRRFVAECDDPE
jgi:hypothetical protein